MVFFGIVSTNSLTLITKAASGDTRAFDLLGKYGYGTKIDFTTKDKELPTPILNGVSLRSLSDDAL